MKTTQKLIPIKRTTKLSAVCGPLHCKKIAQCSPHNSHTMAVDQNTTTPTMAADFVVDVQMPPLFSSSSLSSASLAAVEGGAPIINGIKIFSYTDLKKLKKEDLQTCLTAGSCGSQSQ
ncbi:MAG: hypothetical protein ACREBR_01810 [bacterium]